MSKAYQDFLDNYLNAYSWVQRRDGTPLDLLDVLSEEEKIKAEDELLNKLSRRDTWIIEGLGHLKSRKALPQLYKLLRRTKGSVKAQTALAIWKISGDEQLVNVVLKLSHNTGHYLLRLISSFIEFEMIDIIYCLAQFPQKEAEQRLKELTFDSRYLVSYNANRALTLRKTYYKIEL